MHELSRKVDPLVSFEAPGDALAGGIESSRSRQRVAASVVTLVCIAALVFFVRTLAQHRPLSDWLFWHYARIWAWGAVFTVGCLVAGDRVVHGVLGIRDLPRLETVVLSMVAGVVVFVLSMFALGALGLFKPAAAVALPFACVLVGGRRVLALARASADAMREALAFRPSHALLLVAGVCALALLYVGVMTPGAISTDAVWFHMAAADDYVREGRLVPFVADWAKTLPQLTSILHTWAFLVPGLRTEAHWMLGQHLELILFLFTLAQVVAVVRYLMASEDGYGPAWVVYFTFPSIYIYDSNLGGAADHVQAFFVLPLLLAGLRVVERPAPRMAFLAGLFAGGAFETKVQAVYVALPVAVLIVGRALVALIARVRRGAGADVRLSWLGVLAFGSAIVAVMAPHFLKNATFYGNPFYPFLMDVVPSHPAPKDAQRLFFEHLAPVAQGHFWENARRALLSTATFSFEVTSPFSPRGVPFIGSLFTLLFPVALARRDFRLWGAVFVSLAALFQWAYVFPTPRNLQTCLPVLVAVSATLLAEAWRSGLVARVAAAGLVALQVVWGGNLIVESAVGRLSEAMTLVRSSLDGPTDRFRAYREGFRALDEKLPKDAVVLLHTSYSQLGIHRRVLLDWPGFQGAIDYRPMRTPRDVFDRYAELGVTHIAVSPPWPAHSRQEEALVDAFLHRYAKSLGSIGEFVVWKMPASRPPAEDPFSALCIGMPGYPDGLYRIGRLDNLDDGRKRAKQADKPLARPADAAALFEEADVVFVNDVATLGDEAGAELRRRYRQVASYSNQIVFLKKRSPARADNPPRE